MLQKLRGKDLNQRPPGYEPDELPDCSTPRYSIKHKCQKETNYLVSLRGVDQIWTGDEGVADLCLTTWLRRHNMTPTGFEPMLPPWKGGVLTTWPRSQTPRVGLEPTTARLTAACSTDWAIEEYIRYMPWKPHTLYHIFLIFASTFLRSSFRPISNSQLHTSLCFHLCPIYLIVSKGSLTLSSMDISSWGGLHA